MEIYQVEDPESSYLGYINLCSFEYIQNRINIAIHLCKGKR